MSSTSDYAAPPPFFLLPPPQRANASVETPLTPASPGSKSNACIHVCCSVVDEFGGKALCPPLGECPLDPRGSDREDTWNSHPAMCPHTSCGAPAWFLATTREPPWPRTCSGSPRNRVLPFAPAALQIWRLIMIPPQTDQCRSFSFRQTTLPSTESSFHLCHMWCCRCNVWCRGRGAM